MTTRPAIRTSTVLLLLAAVLAGSVRPAQAMEVGLCPMTPPARGFAIPARGFEYPPTTELAGRCDPHPDSMWFRESSGEFDLFAALAGPEGSGRYWRFQFAIARRGGSRPGRGICLFTSTVGWRTLRSYGSRLMPWLEDIDGDGSAEIVVWNSFYLGDPIESSMAQRGLMAWVYRPVSLDSLALDWPLSRRMAYEIAAAYRLPLSESGNFYVPSPTLREQAARDLEMFARQRCFVDP